jgi:hypothetical protein
MQTAYFEKATNNLYQLITWDRLSKADGHCCTQKFFKSEVCHSRAIRIFCPESTRQNVQLAKNLGGIFRYFRAKCKQ